MYKRKSPTKRKTVQKSPKRKLASPKKSPKRKTVVRKSPTRRITAKKSPTRKTRALERSYVKNDTKKLTVADFDSEALEKPVYIVVMYSNGCGHCQVMKEKLGAKMKDTMTVKFVEEANLDSSATDYFPHILYYENGKKKKDLNVEELYHYLGV